MLPFDEDRTPLTLDNVRSWAHAKFPGAFNVLPKLDEATFLQVDDFTFARFIKRCLGRSEHKRLLVVGAQAPDEVAEDALVCAHVHADDQEVNYFWLDVLSFSMHVTSI